MEDVKMETKQEYKKVLDIIRINRGNDVPADEILDLIIESAGVKPSDYGEGYIRARLEEWPEGSGRIWHTPPGQASAVRELTSTHVHCGTHPDGRKLYWRKKKVLGVLRGGGS